MGKSLSNKYGQKLLDSAKKSTTDAIKTASKRAIQKTVEATGDLIFKIIADKITGVSNKKSNNNNNNNNNEDAELTNHKRFISPEERQQIINELRLVPKKDYYYYYVKYLYSIFRQLKNFKNPKKYIFNKNRFGRI